MALETKDIEKLAKLSRLQFSAEKLPQFAGEFESILEFVGQIQGLKTEGVPPMTGAADVESSPEREDVAVIPADPIARRDALMANAPKREQGFFVVPKIVE